MHRFFFKPKAHRVIKHITKKINSKMKRRFSLLVLFVLLVSAIQAQNGTIKGKIVDESNLALPGAYIYTQDKQYVTTSDINGNYYITDVPGGEYDFKITYIGFEDIKETVTISAGKTTIKDFKLKSGIGLDEVVISSSLQGQSKALNQQKNNAKITNVIASDQIGKFPDANIGDALKRIPGINVQYDMGEARFGTVRGIAPQYNSVTINGERIPSAEAETRAIQLDLIPSDMIQMVEVNKAVTPDMDGDAIGGSINLVTLSQPYKERFSAALGSGYNYLAEKPTLSANMIYGRRIFNDNLGMEFSVSYDDNQLGADNVEAEWDGTDDDYELTELNIRQYYSQRIRQSYSANFDYRINNNHTLYLKGMYNRRKDWENRYRDVFKPEKDKVEKEIKSGTNDKNARLEDQQMMQFSLNGDHLFGKIKADWGISYSKASEDRPGERYLTYVLEDVPFIDDISDPEKPYITTEDESLMFFSAANGWEFDEFTEENQYTEDIDLVARLNFEIPLAKGTYKNSIKFGGKYKSKSKKRDNDFYSYEPTSSYESTFNNNVFSDTKDWTKDNFIPGDKYNVGNFTTRELVGQLDLTNTANFEGEPDYSEYAGNFDANEDITAGYIMLTQQLGDKLSGIIGVRVENTSNEGEGFTYDDDAETLTPTEKLTHNYTNVLPDLHLKYEFSKSSILRIAYTTTIARPGYFDLIPYQQLEESGTEISVGNPELDPTNSRNIDLMMEHYFKSIGIVSGGFFYKDIKDFIVDENHEDYLGYTKYSQPINGGDANIWGLEFSAQRQLNFLPGLGIYANYTYTNATVSNFNIEDRENEDVDMMGSPEHTINASLSYDKKAFSARVSYNYASAFVDEYGGSAFEDVYYDEVTHVDVNLNYHFKKHYLVYASLNNLTNQPLRYYQGKSDRTYQMEFYGMTAKFGIKLNF